MTSGWLGSRRLRFDLSEPTVAEGPYLASALELEPALRPADERLADAVARTRDWLLAQQHDDGYWCAELEGDTILESEYLLLLAYLGREKTEEFRLCCNYILQQQMPCGGWSLYPGGPLEISSCVKAYFVLKLAGHSPDAEYMVRARDAIRRAGGAERVNSFTRYYLALLGIVSYKQCPAVPPELMLIPRWAPFNIYEMSAWSRTILVPLSLLWAYQPSRQLPPELHIDELFLGRPEDLPVTMYREDGGLGRPSLVDWDAFFRQIDRGIKLLERCRVKPLRRLAIRRAKRWMLNRFAQSDGLGAIFPPIIWSVVALKCLGYKDDSREIQAALSELRALEIREGDAIRLQPCKSPVWDTAIASIALRESGVSENAPAVRSAVNWLLSKEVRCRGDWSVRNPQQPPGGWFFEFNNEFYPDVDDTSMVVMALSRCIPGSGNLNWSADYFLDRWSPHEADRDVSALLATRTRTAEKACRDVEAAAPVLNALWRGARWTMSMQNRDGGWGAFDRDNDRELFTRVPFADHNAMIDPSTADITARILEMLAHLNVSADQPAVQRALAFVWADQQEDGCWYGRWGVNYIYGTWQCLVGLTRIGVSPHDARLRRAADWLKSKQQACGGWGESPRTYDDPSLRGQGEPTASQTAWALMGLMAAGEVHSDEVRRGIQYLLDTQNDDGTWDEPWYTGTGFPKVFYLRYHYYRIYFPLMALARYRTLTEG